MKKLKIYLMAFCFTLTMAFLATQKSYGQASGGPVLTLLVITVNGTTFYDCQSSPRDCWTGEVIG